MLESDKALYDDDDYLLEEYQLSFHQKVLSLIYLKVPLYLNKYFT